MMSGALFTTLLILLTSNLLLPPTGDSTDNLLVANKTEDFTITGDGKSVLWNKAAWLPITVQESSGDPVSATRVKVLYSDRGLYFLFFCEDQKITATIQEDYGALYNEDVVEVFLWPDESVPVYFEYEISPLNFELPILVPNMNDRFYGWKPWHYDGDRKIQHATSAQGGEKKSRAEIKSWMAEFFIPFKLLQPMVAVSPKSGDRWRVNLYRIDYDKDYTTWSWQKTSGSFHEFKKYGTLLFE
jgi:hypothetical protein